MIIRDIVFVVNFFYIYQLNFWAISRLTVNPIETLLFSISFQRYLSFLNSLKKREKNK